VEGAAAGRLAEGECSGPDSWKPLVGHGHTVLVAAPLLGEVLVILLEETRHLLRTEILFRRFEAGEGRLLGLLLLQNISFLHLHRALLIISIRHSCHFGGRGGKMWLQRTGTIECFFGGSDRDGV